MRFNLHCARTTQDAAQVLPQIRRAGCNEIITTFAPSLARLFTGKSRNELRSGKSQPTSPRRKRVRTWGSYCVGHQADRKPWVKLSPMEASIEGRLRRTGICLTYTGESLTKRWHEGSTKNETPNNAPTRQTIPREGNRQAMRGASPRCPARQPERLKVRP